MPAGAGLVLSVRGQSHFLPALLVHSVQSCPRLSPVPGSSLAMAWVGGKVIPVARIGDQGSHLVVCLAGGEIVGLSGVEVQKTGFFDASGDGVSCDGQTIPPLDVARELSLAASEDA